MYNKLIKIMQSNKQKQKYLTKVICEMIIVLLRFKGSALNHCLHKLEVLSLDFRQLYGSFQIPTLWNVIHLYVTSCLLGRTRITLMPLDIYKSIILSSTYED